jgi:hypothetical protein
MFKQGKKILLGAGVLAAISFGGSALSAAGAAPVTPVVQHPAATAPTKGATGSEMETGNEAPGTETNDGTSQEGAQQGPQDEETQDGANDGETADGAQGAQDTETADGSSESSGSEVPGNDGPGGHADEPGNPNAQNQE